ncbi:MAG: type II toxin-antitoxin system VapC family toxin [Hyphomonadaceae bacterium]|nr:type II toxin-antitoxin system VapC family toxin [Hyphomonadaceae bacterium]
MSVVIDASVAFAWILPSQRTQTAQSFRMRPDIIAPFLFEYELRAGLLAAERRRRISRDDVDAEVSAALALIAIEPPPHSFDPALALARSTGLTFYDATYLERALTAGAELATRDQALLDAAARIGIQIVDAR